MSVSLYLQSITNAIAAISISGVTVKDSDEIVASWAGTPNILYPNPNDDGFITNFRIQYDSIMQGADAPMTIGYTLNYRFLGTQIGDLATFPAEYANIVSKVAVIVNALITVPAPYSGRVELTIGGVTVGAKADPVGNMYHGADFALNITEMQN